MCCVSCGCSERCPLPRPPGTWRGLRVAIKTVVVHDALMGKEVRGPE